MSEPVKVAEYDVDLESISVVLKKKDGTARNCTLNEVAGPELEKYMNENKSRMDVVIQNGKVIVKGMKSYDGMFASLLKFALRDDEGKLFSVADINALPPRVQQDLFKKAQKLSALETSNPIVLELEKVLNFLRADQVAEASSALEDIIQKQKEGTAEHVGN